MAALPPEAIITRRFGVRQGGKTRPIDNYLESGVNATASAEDTVTVHTADCIAAGVAHRMRAARDRKKSLRLVARSWDLSKAYKNLPLHSESLNDAFLCVFNPDTKKTEVYGQVVLPFGARASVHGFCRTSLGVWVIGTSLFTLHWSVFFDDFVGFESPELARVHDLCVATLFNLLGWETASDKETSFGSIAQVLGLEINLNDVNLGKVYFCNTENRKADIADALGQILATGHLSRKDGERLRGRLQFCENQIAGKQAGLAFRELSRHVLQGGGVLQPQTKVALDTLRVRILEAPPRCVSDRSEFTWHVYVDAANDGGTSGVGGVLVSGSGAIIGHFSETLGEDLVKLIGRVDSENPIFELECFAIYCALHAWKPLLRECGVVLFSDNEGTLHCMISGRSKNDNGGRLVEGVHKFCDSHFISPWFERVNTASNVADAPSRGVSNESLGARAKISCLELAQLALEDLG